MDADLARLERASRDAPGDVGALLRLAANLERAGRASESAARLLAGLEPSPERDGGPVGRSGVAAALSALAGRAPSAVVAALEQASEGTARLGLEALVLEGALAVPVALACSPADLARDACEALRLDHERELRSLPGLHRFRQLVLSRESRLDARRRGNGRDWIELARRVIETARRERRLALVPWLHALADVPEAGLGVEARAAFRDLTGREEPPLDPAELPGPLPPSASG